MTTNNSNRMQAGKTKTDHTATETEVAVSMRQRYLEKFLDELMPEGGLNFIKVYSSSSDKAEEEGYCIAMTDNFDAVKNALINSTNSHYRGVGKPILAVEKCGIVYVSTNMYTHLFFLISAETKEKQMPKSNIVSTNEGKIGMTVAGITTCVDMSIAEIKDTMVNGYLEKVKMQSQQKTDNTTNGVEVMIVEPAKQFHDETQFVLRSIDKSITKNPGLEVVYMQIQGDTPDVQYSVMFTNRFDTLVDVLVSGANTKFTECRTACPTSCGIGSVDGHDDNGDYKEYYFFVIDLGNKFSPATFNDDAFLKQTFTHVKWAFESVERYRARRMYEVQDKGDTVMQENQVPVNEVQEEAIPDFSKRVAMTRVVLDLFCNSKSTMLWEANIKISQNLDYAKQGYNILVVNNVDAFTDILVDQKNACSLDTNIIGAHVAMGMATNDDLVVMFYIVDKTHELASAVDSRDLTINGCIDSYMRHVGASHADNMASLNQHFQQKIAKATMAESADPVPVEKPTTRKIMSMPTNPIGEAPRYRPLLEEYGMREPEHVVNARYDRFTFATSIDEDLNKYSLYLHPTHCVTSLQNLLEVYKAYNNMPVVPVAQQEDFQPVCRLQKGRVYWNRFALLSDHSVQTNKKDFKGVNHYVLHLHDHNNRSFVIAVYADFTKRKRPAMVYNVYEILKAGETPFNCGGISRDVFQYLMQIMGAM